MGSDGAHFVMRSSNVERDQELELEVAKLWTNITKQILVVLDGNAHGYERFLEVVNPSIEEIIEAITEIENLMNKMLDGVIAGELPVDVELKLNNCQQCTHLIRRVHISLKHDNQHEYDDVIRKLSAQSLVL